VTIKLYRHPYSQVMALLQVGLANENVWASAIVKKSVFLVFKPFFDCGSQVLPHNILNSGLDYG